MRGPSRAAAIRAPPRVPAGEERIGGLPRQSVAEDAVTANRLEALPLQHLLGLANQSGQ